MPAIPDIPTDMHLPAEQAPTPTYKVAHCKVCKTQWEVKSGDKTDAKGCNFCGADKTAVTITDERPR